MSVAWPRDGYPILPTVLRNLWWKERIPDDVCRAAGLDTGTTYGSLGAEVWREGKASGVYDGELADHLVKIVQARLVNAHGPERDELAFPHLVFDDVVTAELPLSTRPMNALRDAGLRDEPSCWIPKASLSLLLELRNIGARSFLELATVIEAHGTPKPGSGAPETAFRDASLEEALAKLEGRFPLFEIAGDDPRLAGLLPMGKGSLGEQLRGVVDGARTQEAQRLATSLVRETEEALHELQQEGLEDALRRVVSVCTNSDLAESVIHRLGWDGDGGCTLQTAGKAAGVTRERIRQIEKKIKDRSKHIQYLPQLDKAIRVLNRNAQDPSIPAAEALEREGLASGYFKPYGIDSAAKVFGKQTSFKAKMGRAQVETKDSRVERTVSEVLRSLGDMAHVATVEEVQARLKESHQLPLSCDGLRQLLPRLGEFYWLDDEENWFWHPLGRGGSRFLNFGRKILAVAPQISIEKLREGMFRHHRCSGLTLPRAVVPRFLEAAGFRVRDGIVYADDADLSEALSESDKFLVETLEELECVADYSELLSSWDRTKWSRATLEMWLGNAPFVERVAPSVYALRGRPLDPARVERLIQGRNNPTPRQDHGWTSDGSIWIGFVVTVSLYRTNVVHIPNSLRAIVGNGPFELFTVNHNCVGEMRLNDQGQGWGLGPFFNRRGVEIGDVLVITLDLELGAGYLFVGDQELLSTYSDGSGKGPRSLMDEATAPMVR